MYGLPRTSSPLPRSPAIRFAVMGTILGAMVYLVLFWRGPQPIVDPTELATPPAAVEVPQLDRAILQEAADGTRQERLVLEPRPLEHLLEKSLNVSPPVAEALGRTEHPVPIADLRADPARWRGQWLWYKGRLEDLTGPKPGHPVRGYSIWEATVRLADGAAVLCAFSLPPDGDVRKGGIVRVEGFLLKLRDTTFPVELAEVPMLVGPRLVRDYEDWPPVTELDAALLEQIDDGRFEAGRFEPGPAASFDLAADQNVPLWHLASYARTHLGRLDAAQWRAVPAFSERKLWDDILHGRMARGTPLRLLGQFVQSHTTRADPNPAGIEDWTEVWMQIRDLGGKTFPVWIPGRIGNFAQGAGLEVRAHYYKRYVYETLKGSTVVTPVFVAAALDPFVMRIDPSVRQLGIGIAIATMVAVLGIWWSQRRERRRALQAEEQLVARRRQRRAKAPTAAPPAGLTP